MPHNATPSGQNVIAMSLSADSFKHVDTRRVWPHLQKRSNRHDPKNKEGEYERGQINF
jgi:hypothetical protein